MTTEKIEDAASLASAYIPLITMNVAELGEKYLSDEKRVHLSKSTLEMLEKMQAALHEAGV
jgi:hypothetical protein